MCFETELSDMSNGRAMSVTLSSPSAARRQTMVRREPSASAPYTLSNGGNSPIRLNISRGIRVGILAWPSARQARGEREQSCLGAVVQPSLRPDRRDVVLDGALPRVRGQSRGWIGAPVSTIVSIRVTVLGDFGTVHRWTSSVSACQRDTA